MKITTDQTIDCPKKFSRKPDTRNQIGKETKAIMNKDRIDLGRYEFRPPIPNLLTGEEVRVEKKGNGGKGTEWRKRKET